MAEHSFQEVMKQWRRFCKSHNNCGECEFDGQGICGEGHLTDIPYANIESRIMAWAAEHPVVYPTWGEWLAEAYGAPNTITFSNSPLADPDGVSPEKYVQWMVTHRVPASIAEKLGLEPKEGA